MAKAVKRGEEKGQQKMCDKNIEEGPLWEGGGPAGEQGMGKEFWG